MLNNFEVEYLEIEDHKGYSYPYKATKEILELKQNLENLKTFPKFLNFLNYHGLENILDSFYLIQIEFKYQNYCIYFSSISGIRIINSNNKNKKSLYFSWKQLDKVISTLEFLLDFKH